MDFNMIRRKRNMFNEEELKFIGDTANRDLESITLKIESLVNDLSRLGKNLCELKIVQSYLISIKQAVKESKQEQEKCNSRCC